MSKEKTASPSKRDAKASTPFSITNKMGVGLLVLLGIIIYSNSFQCSFHFDDLRNIVNAPQLRSLSDVSAWMSVYPTRPFSMFTFALNYYFNEYNVGGYHLVNLMIHLLNAVLVGWLVLLIFSSPNVKPYPIIKYRREIALMTALLFVSHPLATESVTYIIQRMNEMAAMFYLISLTLYMHARITELQESKRIRFFAMAVLAAVLAVMSKENAYSIPVVIVMMELFFIRTNPISFSLKNNIAVIILPSLVCVLVILAVKYSAQVFKTIPPDSYTDFKIITPINYLLTQCVVIIKYIQLFILPINQTFDYDFPMAIGILEPRVLICLLLILSLFITAVYQLKRNRIISFAILWFFITIAIESSVIPISDVIFEHRTYLPSIGYCLLFSTLFYGLFQKNNSAIATALLAVIIALNSYLTYERNKVYKDEFSFWNDAVKKAPNKARPYYNRGLALKETERFEDMLADFTKVIELRPAYIEAYGNRGNVYAKQNKVREALADYSKAIEMNGADIESLYNRAILLEDAEKKHVAAIRDFTKVIELNPRDAEAFYNRGIAEFNNENKEAACMDFTKAAELGYRQGADLAKQYCQ